MDARDLIEMAYNSHPEIRERPDILHHWVGNVHWPAPGVMLRVREEGLRPQRSRFQEICELLPHRPRGVFFWAPGQETDELSGRAHRQQKLSVLVDDLDTGKLFAFPAAAGEWADEVRMGKELVVDPEVVREALAQIRPVAYDEYDGGFLAEWIYCDSVPAGALQWSQEATEHFAIQEAE